MVSMMSIVIMVCMVIIPEPGEEMVIMLILVIMMCIVIMVIIPELWNWLTSRPRVMNSLSEARASFSWGMKW